MNATKLADLLRSSIKHRRPLLIKGAPGIGKSDLVAQVCDEVKADLLLMHPAISDPVDYKGMPAILPDGTAHFLPFGDLTKLCAAQSLTVGCFEEMGQAPPSVQAALLHVVLARTVNGHKISDHVVFIGCTNDTMHLAGVSGLIEPMKSRWTIVQLDVSLEDWSVWALDKGMPSELVAFIRFRPSLLSDFKPTKALTNSPSPRGWASVGNWLEAGVKDLEVFSGAVGEGAATEFYAFLDLYQQLPSLDAILLDPTGSPVPDKPAGLFAVSAGLARKATAANLERANRYMERLPTEFNVSFMRDAVRLNKSVTNCPAFVAWATKHSDVLL